MALNPMKLHVRTNGVSMFQSNFFLSWHDLPCLLESKIRCASSIRTREKAPYLRFMYKGEVGRRGRRQVAAVAGSGPESEPHQLPALPPHLARCSLTLAQDGLPSSHGARANSVLCPVSHQCQHSCMAQQGLSFHVLYSWGGTEIKQHLMVSGVQGEGRGGDWGVS